MSTRDWSIQEVARLAATTSRTLRHYDDVGLLHPSRMGSNGYRYYNEASLRRLQRILLLRDLGLGIPAIAEVLAGQTNDARALETHLGLLRQEQQRLDRQIASVELTITALHEGSQLMAEDMFDGFDHTAYKAEVEERWGAEAYKTSDAWWRAMSTEERAAWMSRQKQLAADWVAAAESAVAPNSAEAQALARRHVEWLGSIPGTPREKEYVLGLGDMYVADDRFAANYGGTAGATFVRDALRAYAEANL